MSEEQKVKFKIEKNTLKIEGSNDTYTLEMIRTIWLDATELSSRRVFTEKADKKYGYDTHSLRGIAKLNKDSLGIIGDKRATIREVPFTIRSLSHEDITNKINLEWSVSIGFYAGDWEIDDSDTWFVEIHIPPSDFNELLEIYKLGRIAKLSFGIQADLYVRDYDIYTPPSGRVTWYLRPDNDGNTNFPELATGKLTSLIWDEPTQKIDMYESLQATPEADEDSINEDFHKIPTVQHTADPATLAKLDKIARGINLLFWVLIFVGIGILIH